MPPDLSRALTVRSDGLLLDLEVTAGAKEDRFPAGYNKWRGRIGCRVRAPPIEGRANQEVCRLVAARLGLPPAQVTLLSGATSTQKTLRLDAVDAETVLARLREGTA